MKRIYISVAVQIFVFINLIQAADRLALVIGNSNYAYQGNLKNPLNDAHDMTVTLRELGFEVITVTDLEQNRMRQVIDRFGERLRGIEVGLFYYSGHVTQSRGENYLIPVDAGPKTENDVEYQCVKASRVLGKMQYAKCKFNIVILDACRDNPFAQNWLRGGSRGLAFMAAPSGSIIAYATSPGKTAADGDGWNGIYTSALLKYIKQPGLTIEKLFKKVRFEVQKISGGMQVPWESTSLVGDFYFTKNQKLSIDSGQELNKDIVTNFWANGNEEITWIFIQGGTFLMGDTFGQGDIDEQPVHNVTLSSYYLSASEVTVAQYRAFCKSTDRIMPEQPFWGWEDDHPIVNVAWYDATEFCKWAHCRIPTEAEWEYAARERGRYYRFGNGKDIADPNEVNFDCRFDYKEHYSIVGAFIGKTVPVANYAPNRLGIYDMSGNVWEWCWDWYHKDYYKKSLSVDPKGPSSGDFRVIRGGCWESSPHVIRAAVRFHNFPGDRSECIGFRVAKDE